MGPLDKVEVEVTAAIGSRAMRLGDVLRLRHGALIALETDGRERVALMVGEHRIGGGRLAVDEAGGRRVVLGPSGAAEAAQQ